MTITQVIGPCQETQGADVAEVVEAQHAAEDQSMAKRWLIGEDRQLVEYGTQGPFVWEPVVVLESDYDAAQARIRELEADNAEVRRHCDEVCSAEIAFRARIRELESRIEGMIEPHSDEQKRISEGERLFKKMLMMSGPELGGPHPIWADVERWLGNPPSSQSDRQDKP